MLSSAKDELIARCLPFLEEIMDKTPGTEIEQWLNRVYGPNSELYKHLARLIRIGVEDEGWAANIEISGRRDRCALLPAGRPHLVHGQAARRKMTTGRNPLHRRIGLDTLMQTAIYAGVPAANTAFAEAGRIIAELDATDTEDKR